MNPLQAFRKWWQLHTGEEDSPIDSDSFVWVFSMAFHMLFIFGLSFVDFSQRPNEEQVSIVAPPPLPEIEEPEVIKIDEVYFSDQPSEEVGANSVAGEAAAMSFASMLSEVSTIPSPVEAEPVRNPEVEMNNVVEIATGLHFNETLAVKGAAGEGTTGAVGAVDRITHEIIRSLEERKTLVVWLFDQSPSMLKQRESINERFDQIYKELGILEQANNPAFAKHKDKPLLTQIISFGDKVAMRIKDDHGTDDLALIQKTVSEIEMDETGNEKIFSAIYMAADKYKNLRVPGSLTREPDRNVMIIAFTDERGDDIQGLDQTVKLCRRYEIPVYVVGVPAPFGREETMVKWIDPDPKFDQTPQWGVVSQGPESFMPERVKISFSDIDGDSTPIDSGFGPYALTRLAYETGGIFFTVHPNRNVNRMVRRDEIDPFSAHLSHFFDPEVMRPYRPDYVTQDEYMRRLQGNKARAALVQASQMSNIGKLENPALRFPKLDEATFVNALTEAQKDSAKLGPKIETLYQVLKLGEGDREKETSLRWQAGYDLAMGQVLANKVRTETYNAMLAQAKRGLKFEDAKNNTWILEPANEIKTGSADEKAQQRALMYLKRVVEQHPDTPWAMLAQRELDVPVGWTWKESFTEPPKPNMGDGGGGGNNVPANDAARMIKRGPELRKPPKL